jgi:hypothetical protein
MARIRTIKPDFFRHEGLQDLEAANPGRHAMLVFCGLWGHCDKAGRFEWRPRQLKLDVLPFLEFDMLETLELLERAGFVRRYVIDGKTYGLIETFPDHQRITGKEGQEPEKHPAPTSDAFVTPPGHTRDHPDVQEGKGREEEREEEGKGVPRVPALELARRRDVVAALEQWNALAAEIGLPVAQHVTRQRSDRLRKRLTECGGLEGWAAALAKVRDSPFLRGENNRHWRADLDFMLQESSFVKVMEGKYDCNRPASNQSDQALRDGLAAGYSERFGDGEAGDQTH